MADYLNNAKDTLKQNIPSTEAISEGLSNAANTVRETTKNATADFSSKGVMDASKEFLNSNSLIARFVFIILVLIAFMILLNLGVGLVTYLTTPSLNPYIIHGSLPGGNYKVYPQDPGSSNSVVYRSNNKSGGAEFTWAMWLKLDSLPNQTGGGTNGKPANCVFVKGTDSFNSTTGFATVNNAPGVYLDSSASSTDSGIARLIYVMDVVTPDGPSSPTREPIKAIIPNIPIGKWFHVAIRLQNKTLDCYINGVITTRASFGDLVPKQNYDPIVFAGGEAFRGAISNLRYYSYALSVFELNSIVYYGPNLKAADSGANTSFFDYLGKRWYSQGQSV